MTVATRVTDLESQAKNRNATGPSNAASSRSAPDVQHPATKPHAGATFRSDANVSSFGTHPPNPRRRRGTLSLVSAAVERGHTLQDLAQLTTLAHLTASVEVWLL